MFVGPSTERAHASPQCVSGHGLVSEPPLPHTGTSLASSPSFKPGLCGFRKVGSTEEPGPCPIPGLGTGVLRMRVKEGSKIRNLLGFAMSRMRGEDSQATQVLFTGLGRAVTKTITCAEIMKREVPGLHQLTRLQQRIVGEVWESRQSAGTQVTVHKPAPSICILLSKQPLDPRQPGYQPPDGPRCPPAERQREDAQTVVLRKRRWDSYPPEPLPGSKRACLDEDRHSTT